MGNRPRLPPNQQLIRTDRWPLVGERLPREDASPWTITVGGLVSEARTFSLDNLQALPQIDRTLDIHCVTRWSRFDMTFGGVALSSVLPDQIVDPATRFVSFVARTDRAHSSSLPLDELRSLDAMLATSVNGKPLTTDHGGPVRLIVPGKYFYKSVKWLERIECIAEDRLGFWESEAGYHNGADPWLEQRYIAPGITRQQAAALIAGRDFSHRNLRSIDASNRSLEGLAAQHALLRDADFRRAVLIGADFSNANLSNAHFQKANLQQASFAEADIEGAAFSAADLRGADLRVASLFGASFCEVSELGEVAEGAILDGTTRIHVETLDALTPEQRDYVLWRLR
jgi:DMSO/TMAO reductase YedYZ molybdopterin-dependent catalytic subunit